MAPRTKFVIYGQSRSGSTLLTLLLRSHPEVHCDRELLNRDHEYVRSRLALEAWRLFPLPLVCWRLVRSGARVYGFKLMVGNARAPRLTLRMLRWLGWRIIHVHREDVAAGAISELVARKTQRWARRRGEHIASPRITIDPDEFLEELRRRMMHQVSELDVLAGVSHLRIVYEQHLRDEEMWDDAAKALCRFLGIPERRLTAEIVKTHEEPYERFVENYDDLATIGPPCLAAHPPTKRKKPGQAA